jgi:hypothetical protein
MAKHDWMENKARMKEIRYFFIILTSRENINF